MIFAALHLIFLVLAPQLWLAPFVGIPVDKMIFPLWAFWAFATGRISDYRFGPQEKFFMFFLLWIGASLARNGIFLENIHVIMYYLQLFLVYILVAVSFRSSGDVKVYLILLVFIALVLAFEGINHYINGIGWAGQNLGWTAGEGKGRTRWVGIFDGPGVFCVIYTVALPFVLSLTHQDFRLVYRILASLSLVLLSVAIYFNGSRGGFLTTLAILLMHYGVQIERSRRIVLIVAGLGVLVLFHLAPSHMTQLGDSHHSTSHRIDMWAEGCDMVKQSPIFGIGPGNFKKYSGSLVAHNSFIEIMGETGVVGLSAWISLIYFSVKALFRLIYEFKDVDASVRISTDFLLVKALLISIIGYLISAFFVTLEYPTLYILLALSSVFAKRLKSHLVVERKDVRNIVCCISVFIIFVNAFTHFIGSSAFV